MEDNQILTITMEQLMERTGLKQNVVYKLIREGKLKTLAIQKRNRLFNYAEVKKLLGLKD